MGALCHGGAACAAPDRSPDRGVTRSFPFGERRDVARRRFWPVVDAQGEAARMGYFDTEHPTLLADPVTERDHVRGQAGAAVTVVEYGDFACPSCGAAFPIVKALLARFPDVRLVFRANPRSHLFPHALEAAEAAEAAGAQGKFWEMHDLLFQNQDTLSPQTIREQARALDLDLKRFESELQSGAYMGVGRGRGGAGGRGRGRAAPAGGGDGVR